MDERHGGGSIEAIAEHAISARSDSSHFGHTYADGAELFEWLQDQLPPHGQEWDHGQQIISWYRDSHMKKVSLKLILQRVVLNLACNPMSGFKILPLMHTRITPKEALAHLRTDNRSDYDTGDHGSNVDKQNASYGVMLRIPCELQETKPILHELGKSPFDNDIFLSSHHPASLALKAVLERQVPGIKIYLPREGTQAEAVAVARCRATVVIIDDGHMEHRSVRVPSVETKLPDLRACILTSDLYRTDIEMAIAASNSSLMVVKLLHILPSAFQHFLTSSSTQVLVQQGLFNSIAVPCRESLCDDQCATTEYDLVSIHRLLLQIPPIENAPQRQHQHRGSRRSVGAQVNNNQGCMDGGIADMPLEQRGERANTINTVYTNPDSRDGVVFQSNPVFDSGMRAQVQQNMIPPWKKKAQAAHAARAAQADRDDGGASAGAGVVVQVPRWKQKALAKGYTDGGGDRHRERAVSSSHQGDLLEFDQVTL
jgi:hypothetical protein